MSWLGWLSWALGWLVAIAVSGWWLWRERAHRRSLALLRVQLDAGERRMSHDREETRRKGVERVRAVAKLMADHRREERDLRRGLFAAVLAAGGEVRITDAQMIAVERMELVSTTERGGEFEGRILRVIPWKANRPWPDEKSEGGVA